jgi:ABC-2 type transport system permease protein
VFTGVAAVAAQLTFGARAAYAITGAAIGAAYFARAVGDTGPQAVSWSSPIGWGQASPALRRRALVAACSCPWRRRRCCCCSRCGCTDGGTTAQGLWSDRAPRLRDQHFGSWHLVWHLQKGTVLGWAAATSIVGVGYGALATSADDVVGDSGGCG